MTPDKILPIELDEELDGFIAKWDETELRAVKLEERLSKELEKELTEKEYTEQAIKSLIRTLSYNIAKVTMSKKLDLICEYMDTDPNRVIAMADFE